MTKNVVPISHGLRDRERVRVVVLDHVVAGPGTRRVAAIDETLGVDLEEFQTGLVGLGAVAIAGGQVVEDRAMVALGPRSPLQFDLGTGFHVGCQGARLALLVADDVGGLVVGRRNGAQVGGFGGPANGLGSVVRVSVLVDEVSTIAVKVSVGLLFMPVWISKGQHTIGHQRQFRRHNRDQQPWKQRQACQLG